MEENKRLCSKEEMLLDELFIEKINDFNKKVEMLEDRIEYLEYEIIKIKRDKL